MSIDGRLVLETPESVEIHLQLAGIGSRGCAAAIDALIVLAVLLTVGIAVGLLAAIELIALEGRSWVIALWIVVSSLLMFGYHAGCELLMAGQTPGKRMLGLRVLREDGTPAAPLDLVVRNVVRLVDWFPAFYGVGLIVMFVHPRHARLGDLAARTLVVKETGADHRAHTDRPAVPVQRAVVAAAARLTNEERSALASFLERRHALDLAARTRIARRLAQSLQARHGGDLTPGDEEDYLVRLAEGRHGA